MTGAELTAVWVVGVLLGSATVSSVAKTWWAGRVEIAKAIGTAQVDAAKAHARGRVDGFRVLAEAQAGPMTLPAWMSDGEA